MHAIHGDQQLANDGKSEQIAGGDELRFPAAGGEGIAAVSVASLGRSCILPKETSSVVIFSTLLRGLVDERAVEGSVTGAQTVQNETRNAAREMRQFYRTTILVCDFWDAGAS